MRKKFIIIVFIPLVALATAMYFFIDEWVESGFEAAGEAIVGAKVEIDKLSITLSPLAIRFERMQVANPKNTWKNVFETGHVRAALDVGQLLRGKYIIETVEVNELILGTKRTTDGALPKKPAKESTTPSFIKEAADKIAGEVARAPVFDLQKLRAELKIDSLLDVHALKTLQHIDTLKQRVREAELKWKAVVADFERSKQRLAEIEATVRAIKVDGLKTVDGMLKAVENVNSIHKNVNELNETYKSRRSSVEGHIKRIVTSVDTVDDLARQDYERLKSLARLPDMSMTGLANLLLGKALLAEVDYYLGWIDYVRATVPKYIPKPDYERPKRFEGQDIHFPTERSYPKLWIKRVLISGGEDRTQNPEYYYARGKVKNITNNQRQTGEPMTATLAAKKGDNLSLTFNGVFDRRKDAPHDKYLVHVASIALSDFTVGRVDFLPSRITRSTAQAEIAVDVVGPTFDSKLSMHFANVTLEYDRSPKNDVERIVRDVLQAVNRFNVSLRLWNAKGKVDIAFTTDLDDHIAARTRQVIGDELTRLQNEIRAKVNQRIAEKRQEFERLFNQKKEEVLAQVKQYENLVNEKLALVETKKKELEARIEEEKKEQTDAARKKLEDAVRGLIRKQ